MDNWKPWSGLKKKKNCFDSTVVVLGAIFSIWPLGGNSETVAALVQMKTDSLIELTYRSYFSISCELTAIFCWWVDQSGWSIVIVHLEIRKWWIDFLRIDGSSRIFHTGFISKWMDETEWEKSVGKFQLATANGRLKESQKERKRERTGRRNSSGAGNRSRRIRNWLNQKPDICYGHFDWWTVQFRNGFIVNYRVAPRHLTIPPFHSISWSENHSSSNVKSELGGPETHRMVRAIGSHWNDNEWLIWSINTFNVVGHGPGPTTSRPRPA